MKSIRLDPYLDGSFTVKREMNGGNLGVITTSNYPFSKGGKQHVFYPEGALLSSEELTEIVSLLDLLNGVNNT